MSVRGTESIWEIETFGEVLVDLTVGDLIDQQANEFPHHEALVYRYPECGIDLRLTYSELKERVDRVARGLIALGVGPGDKVAVLATNLPQWIFLELAVAKIGSIVSGWRTHIDSMSLRGDSVHYEDSAHQFERG